MLYTFGDDLPPIRRRDLHNFLADAKSHIKMSLLIKMAFATAAEAETWISIAAAFGIEYSTPIAFVQVLFTEYPVLKKHYQYEYSKQNLRTVHVRSRTRKRKYCIDPKDMVL